MTRVHFRRWARIGPWVGSFPWPLASKNILQKWPSIIGWPNDHPSQDLLAPQSFDFASWRGYREAGYQDGWNLPPLVAGRPV